MHNLNLYNYYDKSLADINKEYLESLKYKPTKAAKKRFDKRHALALAIILLTGLGIANYLGVFSEPVVEVVQAPPPIDTRTEEEKLGYVQIQIFEFTDTPVETLKEETASIDNTKLKEIGSQLERKQNVQPVVEPVKPAVVKKAPPPATQKQPVIKKEYAILFENISEEQFNKVKELSNKSQNKYSVLDTYSNTYTVWKVYEKNDAGSDVVDNVRVNHMEDFLTQDDATEYARKRNLQSLIKQINVTEKTYNIKVCCTNIDNAKKIAQNSNITDRTIKIIREK